MNALTVTLPNGGWRPRRDQLPLWSYLERGGKRAVQIAHRRWGKDDVALHWTAIAANDVGYDKCLGRVGTYWHLLPQANQARRAIWEAVNPRTGKRRVDEAFPAAIVDDRRETDMFYRFKTGSTWQVVGSDNFDSLVGSPPVGLVFSEWALADPRAWALLRPIVDENNGTAVFITTPRGRNHALRTLELAKKESPRWFASVVNALQSPVYTTEQLAVIKREMIAELGSDDGEALFDQEYLCSFDAPLLGAYYAKLISKLELLGRIRPEVELDPLYPVETAWDLGYSDDTAIWFFQNVRGEIRVLDYYATHGQPPSHYAEVLQKKADERGFRYWVNDPRESLHWVPWDARPKTLASGGKSLLEIFWNDHQVSLRVVKNLGVEQGIQAARRMLEQSVWIDSGMCATGIDCLRNYRRDWDEDRKVWSNAPLHDWASHGADAFRTLAVAVAEREPLRKAAPEVKTNRFADVEKATFNDLVSYNERVGSYERDSW